MTKPVWHWGEKTKVTVKLWDYNRINLINASDDTSGNPNIEIRLVHGNFSSAKRDINHEKTEMVQTGTGTYEISYTVPEQDIDHIKIEVDVIKNQQDSHNYAVIPIKDPLFAGDQLPYFFIFGVILLGAVALLFYKREKNKKRNI